MDAASCTVLPASCSLCGFPLPRFPSVPICAAIWTEISFQNRPTCVRLGQPLDQPRLESQSAKPGPCRTCRLAPPPFARAISFGPYRSRMREVIHALKHDRFIRAARKLGGLVAQTIAQLGSEAPTDSQAGLAPPRRRFNVRGTFRVSNPESVASKHVLVVDDIPTSGATDRACARELPLAGAESVCVATLARVHRIHHSVSAGSAVLYNDDLDRDSARSAAPGLKRATRNHERAEPTIFLTGDKGCRWEKQ
jgi:predicted amidophosphoribosyltransferase